MAKKVRDLRSALELLAELPGQLLETDVEVEPMAQLSGVYRYVGAGGTVKRPTKEGPAMIFHNVKGHPDASVAIGVLASRKRVAALLDCKPEELGKMLCRSVEKPVLPVMCQGEPACQQVVHRADEPDFDLYKLVPAPTNTPYDAGPYITLGMCYAAHPDTGAHDVTIHRLCIQGRDELSIFFKPWRRGRSSWAAGCPSPSASEWIRPLRLVPALNRPPRHWGMTSCRWQVRFGESRSNCAGA